MYGFGFGFGFDRKIDLTSLRSVVGMECRSYRSFAHDSVRDRFVLFPFPLLSSLSFLSLTCPLCLLYRQCLQSSKLLASPSLPTLIPGSLSNLPRVFVSPQDWNNGEKEGPDGRGRDWTEVPLVTQEKADCSDCGDWTFLGQEAGY